MSTFKLITFAILISLCTGCNGPQVVPTQAETLVPQESTPQSGEQPRPRSTVPAPGEDTGVIVGQLVHEVSGIGISRQLIYLGEYLPLTPGPGEMIAMQVESSQSTQTDDQGYFVFEAVDPGEYPLIVWNPFSSKVVPDQTGETALNAVVQAGEVTDLEKISVIWP